MLIHSRVLGETFPRHLRNADFFEGRERLVPVPREGRAVGLSRNQKESCGNGKLGEFIELPSELWWGYIEKERRKNTCRAMNG